MSINIDCSVIITTFNRANFFLSRAVESVVNQETTFSYEIIVVDDNGFGSNGQKETATILSTYIKNKDIRYLIQENNAGACDGRNAGLEIALGRYIFFLDDDDEYLPKKIQVQTFILENNSYLDGCLAGFQRFESKKEIFSKSNQPIVGNFVNFAINGNFFTPMLCIKRTSLLKIGGFQNIERFQDRYMLLNALSNGLKFDCIVEPLHIMYEHDGERITNVSIGKTIRSLDKIKNFILQYKNLFSISEWNNYLVQDFRKRGIVFYVAKNYCTRISGFIFYAKAFHLSKEIKDLKMMLKTVLKF